MSLRRFAFDFIFVMLLMVVVGIVVALAQDSLGLGPVDPGSPASNVYQILLYVGPLIVLGVTWFVRTILPTLPDWVTVWIIVPAVSFGTEFIRGLFVGASSFQIALLTGAVTIALSQLGKQITPTKIAKEKERIASLKLTSPRG